MKFQFKVLTWLRNVVFFGCYFMMEQRWVGYKTYSLISLTNKSLKCHIEVTLSSVKRPWQQFQPPDFSVCWNNLTASSADPLVQSDWTMSVGGQTGSVQESDVSLRVPVNLPSSPTQNQPTTHHPTCSYGGKVSNPVG